MRARARLVESRAFGLVGCGLGLAVGAVVCAVGAWCWVWPALPACLGVCLVSVPVSLCAACVPALALCWPAGVWAGVRIACRACLACGICCHLGKYPAFPGPDRLGLLPPGGAVAVLPAGLAAVGAVCLVCLLMWAGVCVWCRWGVPGALWPGFWPAAWAGSFAGCPEKTRKFYRKIPQEKRPQKIFQKISPYGGTVCPRKNLAERGLTTALNRAILKAQHRTQPCGTNTQNGGFAP